MDPVIRNEFKIPPAMSDEEAERTLREKAVEHGKPCYELGYCPYGPLVEMFPIVTITREHATRHNEYLSRCLKTGVLEGGQELDEGRRAMFEQMVGGFDPEEYPVTIPDYIKDLHCDLFGHVCPVFLSAEDVTVAERDEIVSSLAGEGENSST
jgi:hypothetical protein